MRSKIEMAKSRRNRDRKSRKNRNRSRRNRNRSRRSMYGGACNLGTAAPYGIDTMAGSAAQSLAQGRQFAEYTRPYHGGRRSHRKLRGGMAPWPSAFGSDGAGVLRASAHLSGQDAALAQARAFSETPAGQDNPAYTLQGQVAEGVERAMAPPSGPMGGNMAGGRRRRSRRGRKTTRRRRMRGGMSIYEGAPWSQNGSDRLLADDPTLMAQAAKMESPAWIGVDRQTYLG
jgi:hypothetical protein